MANTKLVQTSFTADAQSSATLSSPVSHGASKMFTLSISGTWTGTVSLQRSLDNGSNWVTVESYNANTEKNIEVVSDFWVYKLASTAAMTGTAVTAFAK